MLPHPSLTEKKLAYMFERENCEKELHLELTIIGGQITINAIKRIISKTLD